MPWPRSVELGNPPNRLYGFCFSQHDKTGDSDTKRQFGGMRNPNGGFWPFLRRQPAKEGEIEASLEGRPEQVGGQAMINGADPVSLT